MPIAEERRTRQEDPAILLQRDVGAADGVVARDVFRVYETVVLGSTQVAVTAVSGEYP